MEVLFEAQAVSLPVECAVARAVVNIFREASADGEVVSQAIYGNRVVVEERQPGWSRICAADNCRGWIESAGLSELDRAPYAPDGRALRVRSLVANVYSEPSVTSRPPLLHLPWEACLEPATEGCDGPDEWLRIRLVDGWYAWILKGDVVPRLPELSISQTLELSRRFMGITYTWGGVSSFGFDCSGFTQMLMRQRGVNMPRNAAQQAEWSNLAEIELEKIEPGDLLFFDRHETKINHTGMFLGCRQFIHATAHCHPGVQISNLDESPWAATLVAAGRIKR
jgi:hypothetical protein